MTVVGAGVIGACTAFEMAKKGWKTLNIDKLPEAGYGSTSGSCAIIRTYYSAYDVLKKNIPEESIMVGEGANTMDVGRTVF